MTKKEIQKYFDRRPATDTLFVVGTIVFIDPEDAEAYATHQGLTVETKHRDDPDDADTSTDSVSDTQENSEKPTDTKELEESETDEAEEIELREGDTVEDIKTGDVFELKGGELQKVIEDVEQPKEQAPEETQKPKCKR
jgi:hypothetical protein